MVSFAERMGYRATRTIIQSESLDQETRTALWNLLVLLKESLERTSYSSSRTDKTETELLDALWAWYFKEARDERRNDAQVWTRIKTTIIEGEWFEALDLIESTVKYLDRCKTARTNDIAEAIAKGFNIRFEQYLVGYRFIGHEITPIDSSFDADAVLTAIDDANVVAGAHHSLNRAVEHLADRANPDYANSIKESISAVEAVTKKVTGETTLSAGLKKLEVSGLTIHPALKDAWVKMYGWTSDEDGIRHGGIDAASVDQALAKYVLVTCSAFVSYLIEEGRKHGLL